MAGRRLVHGDPRAVSEAEWKTLRGGRAGRNTAEYKKKLADDPADYGKVIVTDLAPPTKLDMAPPGSADMVLTFRNVHNWMGRGYAEDVFKAMFHALKPGGILGVKEHRGDPGVPQDPKAASGYVREDYVIELATQAGFVLMGRAEINANPKDTKNYPQACGRRRRPTD